MTYLPDERVLDRARSVLPVLQDSWRQSDSERRLPNEVVAAIRKAGLFGTLVPLELGGLQVNLATHVGALEIVAQGNSAAAWNLATSAFNGFTALTLPMEGINEVFGKGPHVVFAGTGRADAAVVPEAGGFVVTGRFRFGSGCHHADWLVGGGRLTSSG